MYLQMYAGEEKAENTRARSLASPGRAGAGRGEVRRGDGRTTCAWIVRQNPAQSLAGLIRFDRDRSSQLRDAVNIGRSSLYIRAATTKIATNQQPWKHQHI
jgi:hypothetical protein